jgi:hypothetical protein
VKSFELKGLTSRMTPDSGSNIVYDAESVTLTSGVYDVFVIANYDKVINKENETDFLATVDSIYMNGLIKDISGGIVMTNRASQNLGVSITENPNYEVNTITVYLERVLARIDVQKKNDIIELKNPSDATTYAIVNLDRYYIVNLPRYYYMFRHTADLTSLVEPTNWIVPDNFGTINNNTGFVIDPYFFKKTVDATAFTNGDDYYVNYYGVYNKETVAWETLTTKGTTSYSLENCMFTPAQKNGYSTGVIFSARFAPNNNVYDLVGGTLQLVTDETKYPETLYYYNYKFYASDVALAEATKNNTDLEKYQARKFTKTAEGYRCYYVYWIRHLDNNLPTVMGVMEFGIVRNNLYLINVQDVFGLGYNELIPIPDTPDEGETNLNVILRVKPWIVRKLDIIL